MLFQVAMMETGVLQPLWPVLPPMARDWMLYTWPGVRFLSTMRRACGEMAKQINDAGGNGDDLILDASLDAAATTGIDSADTLFGVASETEEDQNQ